MKIPPSYKLTKDILNWISIIETNRAVIDSYQLPVIVEENFRRRSILGSSLFSARIEGNSLTLNDVSDLRDITSHERRKVEVANLHKAITMLLGKFSRPRKILGKEILNWHQITMSNLPYLGTAGRWRVGHEGIFDQSGNVVYHAPPPSQVPLLIDELLNFINSGQEQNILIRAILAHLVFEKIHPFVDGSGRVGRLLQSAILSTNGYAMKGLVSVEEMIDKKRSLYYAVIENAKSSDSTEFVELVLEFLAQATNLAKEKVLNSQKFQDIDLLPPRRQELLHIIYDHQFATMDFLHRRFLNIAPRLLRYDIKQLIDTGFIKKIGRTRGAMYSVK